MDEKFKILVADDDSFVRDLLGYILEESGHLIQKAEDGKQALKAYRNDPNIDLIISDMNMPELSGLELIKALRDSMDKVPIIILTGNNEIKVAIDAMNNGANNYLLKDENIQDTILISVEKVMEKHILEQQNRKLMEELAIKNEELERLSFLDGLTGIANRRYFDKILEREWARGIRDSSHLSLVMIDIDYFKIYNDTYGHLQGDICLRQVASCLKDSLKRSQDFVSRYGGEEFAAVLPNSDIDGALIVGEIMRSNIDMLNIPHTNSKVLDHVTISIGVGCTVPDNNSDVSNLIKLADKALYEAKLHGRNQVKHTIGTV